MEELLSLCITAPLMFTSKPDASGRMVPISAELFSSLLSLWNAFNLKILEKVTKKTTTYKHGDKWQIKGLSPG